MAEVYILTGPIHSGKTSALKKWIEERTDVRGILSPVVDGKRYFKNVATTEAFPMEADEIEEFFLVGKYRFSKNAFEQANKILMHGAEINNGWLIIDEIGPLELRDQGFSEELKTILIKSNLKVLLVVRENILQQVISHFQIRNHIIINKIDLQNL